MIEDLLAAFESWQEAKKNLLECYADCEVSADYHCYSRAQTEEQKRTQFEDALNQYIDQRIATH